MNWKVDAFPEIVMLSLLVCPCHKRSVSAKKNKEKEKKDGI